MIVQTLIQNTGISMPPKYTYELTILCSGGTLEKESLKSWLTAHGHESFVEGVIDDVDEIHEGFDPTYDGFANSSPGHQTPFILCDYDLSRLEDLRQQLESSLDFSMQFKITRMETKFWMDGWKDGFQPLVMGRFYIHPPWLEALRSHDLLAIEIDPGMAFGTGQHATTQLCLEALSELHDHFSPWVFSRSLDVGTGSGILAIACRKLGCETVDAHDVDPSSISSTQDNAERNKVALSPLLGTLEEVAPSLNGPYDVVLANILQRVIEPIAEELIAQVRKGGFLILSGLLIEQAESILQCFIQLGAVHVKTCAKDGWCSVVLKRPDGKNKDA